MDEILKAIEGINQRFVEIQDFESRISNLEGRKDPYSEENKKELEALKEQHAALEEKRASDLQELSDSFALELTKLKEERSEEASSGETVELSSYFFDEEGGFKFDNKNNHEIKLSQTGYFYRSDLSASNNKIGVSNYVDEVKNVPGFQTTLLDLIPEMKADSRNSVSFPQETKSFFVAAYLTSAAASGQADLEVTNVSGFYVGQEITVSPNHADEETGVIQSIDKSAKTITLAGNLSNTHSIFNRTTDNDEGVVAGKAPVLTAEGEYKPSAELGFSNQVVKFDYVGTTIVTSKQMMNSSANIDGWIKGRLATGVKRGIEAAVLHSAGLNGDMQGLLINTNVNEYNQSSGLTAPVPDTEIDAVRRGKTFCENNGYEPNAVVVSPDMKERLDTVKNSNGDYIYRMSMSDEGIVELWSLKVVKSLSMPNNVALVGDFANGCALWVPSESETTVEVFNQHKDLASRNQMLIRAEENVCFTIFAPKAFCVVNFDGAPS